MPRGAAPDSENRGTAYNPETPPRQSRQGSRSRPLQTPQPRDRSAPGSSPGCHTGRAHPRPNRRGSGYPRSRCVSDSIPQFSASAQSGVRSRRLGFLDVARGLAVRRTPPWTTRCALCPSRRLRCWCPPDRRERPDRPVPPSSKAMTPSMSSAVSIDITSLRTRCRHTPTVSSAWSSRGPPALVTQTLRL